MYTDMPRKPRIEKTLNVWLIISAGAKLVAEGSVGNPVVLASDGEWQGIDVGAGEATLRFTRIENVRNGIRMQETSTVSVKNCVFLEFLTAVSLIQGSVELVNNTFHSANPSGGCVSFAAATTPEIRNNIFSAKLGIGCTNNISLDNVKYNLFDVSASTMTCLQDLHSSNVEGSAEFVDKGEGNVKLLSSSLAIDAGRPDDGYSNEPGCDGNNSRINMGAYGNTSQAACGEADAVRNPWFRTQWNWFEPTTATVYTVSGRQIWHGQASALTDYQNPKSNGTAQTGRAMYFVRFENELGDKRTRTVLTY
jgi:hypothetical protein